MHRNTFLFVSILAVIAALLIGVNIGKKINPQPEPTPTTSNLQPTTNNLQPSPSILTFTDVFCQIALTYPSDLTLTELASGSATIVNADNDKEGVAIACQKDIPKPAIPAEDIESIIIAGVSGILYHTTTAKDATPVDIAIFQHPATGLDIFFSGTGSIFQQILSSLVILK